MKRTKNLTPIPNNDVVVLLDNLLMVTLRFHRAIARLVHLMFLPRHRIPTTNSLTTKRPTRIPNKNDLAHAVVLLVADDLAHAVDLDLLDVVDLAVVLDLLDVVDLAVVLDLLDGVDELFTLMPTLR